ncbi:MAG: SpoIID/LytB domain-containing protein [Endomicrobiia bacterium]
MLNKKFFLVTILLNFLCVKIFSNNTYFVRIGILKDVRSFELSPYEKQIIIVKPLSGKISTLKLKDKTKVFLEENNRIKILNKYYILPVKISSEGKLKINGNIYPQEIEVFSQDKKTLTVVNILDIETYLYGVVPYEIDTNWSEEMLKVQSIIARSYTIANFDRHKNDGYDLCSAVHCQVYKGINEEIFTKVKKAVDSTKGLVIVDNKENPIQAYYHAACGADGTENVVDIWQKVKDFKYLSGVKCDYCKDSPYYSWRYQISQEEMVKKLEVYGVGLKDKIKNIKIISSTKTKRAKEFEIVTSSLSFKIKAEELRKNLGYNNIKSAKISKIELNNENITFYGRGWGHGVGLCQWGANNMSKKGYKFDNIIKHYYPHTKIKKLY